MGRYTNISFSWQVAQLSKFEEGGGLGISLEGTVDVEGGREVRPHHYIRSILPDGPVGKNGRLCSGDELLEVSFLVLYTIGCVCQLLGTNAVCGHKEQKEYHS